MRQDLALLDSWRTRRDAEAFSEIVTRYADLVYGTCLRVLGNRTEAEDVAQDCFARLAESSNRVRSSLGGWLHRMATHQSLNAVKSEARRRQREQRFARDSEMEAQSAEATWEEMRDWVDEAIDALPEKQREVIVAHFLERQTQQATADGLGITRRAVIYRIQKGVDNLRLSLRRHGIQTQAAILPAAFASRAAETAPATLVKQLGKLALAGPGPQAAGLGTILAGTMAWKHVVGALALVAGGLFAAWLFLGSGSGLDAPAPQASETTQPDRVVTEVSRGVAATPNSVKTESEVPAQIPAPTGEAVVPHVSAVGNAGAGSDAAEPRGVIEGYVRTPHGTPIADAAIILQRHPRQDGPLDNAPTTRSAADGSFCLENVNPELGLIFSDHPNYAPGWAPIESNATAVQQVTIVLATGGAIEGHVSVDGRPQGDAHVSVWLGATAKGAKTNAQGAYRIDRLTPGTMPVSLRFRGSQGMARESTRTAQVAADMTTVVDFGLAPASSSIEGIVTEVGQPMRRGFLRLAVTTPSGDRESYSEPVGKGGRYRFSAVPEGQADMLVVSGGPAESALRKSLCFDVPSQAAVVRNVDLSPGNCVISVRVDIPQGNVNGGITVCQGEVDLPQLTVEALQALEPRTVAWTSKMDGTYEFRRLHPGTYTVIAFLLAEKIDSTSDALGRMLFDSQVVALEESQEKVVDLWPIPVQ